MECRTVDLQDLAYGFLDPDAAMRVRDHLADCARCRTAFARLEGERSRLAGAAAALSAPRERRSILPLAFAAGLLAGLLWLLIPRTPPPAEIVSIPAQEKKVKEPSETDLKTEIARLKQALDRTTNPDDRARIQAAIDALQVEVARKPEKGSGPEMKEKPVKKGPGKAEELTKILEKNPNDTATLLARAEEYLKSKRWEPGAQDARRATELAPGEARPWFLLGQACRLLQLGDESEKAFARAVELDPKLAGEIEQLKRTSKTQDKLNAVAGKMKMTSDPEERARLEMQAKDLGQELRLLSQGDRTMADIKEIEAKLQSNPNDPVALVDRASWHLDSGKAGLAMPDLDRAIELKPDFALAYLKRAVAFAMNGETERAWKDYRKGESLDSKNSKLVEMTGGAIKKAQGAQLMSKRSTAEIEREIASLSDRLEELRSMSSNADLAQPDRQRATKEATRVQAEIDRLTAEVKARPPEAEKKIEKKK